MEANQVLNVIRRTIRFKSEKNYNGTIQSFCETKIAVLPAVIESVDEKRQLGLFLILLKLAKAINMGVTEFPEYQNKDDVQLLADSQNKFTRDLYLTLSKNASGNVFFSPFSISTALAMTMMGARGNTEAQMKSTLHFLGESSSIKKAFHEILEDIKKEVPDYELRTSNMAYVSNQLSVLDEFSSTLHNDFFSSSKTVDFGNSEPIREEINKVVEKETNSKIKDLIPSGVLTELTRMVLVNAIYFKGLWLHQFKPSLTKEQPFWVTAEESVNTPLMMIEKSFRTTPIENLDAKLLALDYKGGRLSLVVLLPNKKDGLAAMEAELVNVDFSKLEDNAFPTKVKVFLPKFKLEETLNLIPTLSSMGMTDLFSEFNCDLSGVSGDKSLFVSNVIHKAFLEINEEGSEAAAATAVVMALRSSVVSTPTFVADHPFFFYLRDNRSKQILFAGKFAKPNGALKKLKEDL